MFKKIITLVIILGAMPSFANKVSCTAYSNLELEFKNQIDSRLNEKVSIGRSPSFTAYITEKDKDVFVVEAFIVAQEIRIYGEGVLKSASDHVKTSIWSREEMIDLDCMLADQK